MTWLAFFAWSGAAVWAAIALAVALLLGALAWRAVDTAIFTARIVMADGLKPGQSFMQRVGATCRCWRYWYWHPTPYATITESRTRIYWPRAPRDDESFPG